MSHFIDYSAPFPADGAPVEPTVHHRAVKSRSLSGAAGSVATAARVLSVVIGIIGIIGVCSFLSATGDSSSYYDSASNAGFYAALGFATAVFTAFQCLVLEAIRLYARTVAERA